jgi:poly(hydroxyalkanoate) depolymerase family esterase
MLDQNIIREATSLTRTGRLVEATALLQRMLRSESVDRPRDSAGDDTPARLEPPTIDLKANVVEEGQGEQTILTSAASGLRRKRVAPLDGMLKFPGLGLHGPIRRSPPPTDIAPAGTKFIAKTFCGAAGSRTYKLFVPSRFQGQSLPLIVMLHGCTQSPDDFAAGTRMNFLAEEKNCFVVYPEQPSGANQSKCWNWFRTADQQRVGGEPSLIAGITQQAMRDYPIDPKRVYVAGLSAGGAAAAIMAATHADLYAAVAVHSGLACGAAHDLPSALIAMRQGGEAIAGSGPFMPTIVFHGDRDTTVHPNNADRLIRQSSCAAEKNVEEIKGSVPGGRAFTRKIRTDASGHVVSEHWIVHGAGHAWSGGSSAGSYTDPRGPDATKEMLRFFLDRSLPD